MPLRPALLGGLFMGVLSALPLVGLGNCCCCLWIVSGGMLAAYLDQEPGRPNSLPRGAMDGLLAGIVGAFVFLMLSSVISTLMLPLQERILDELLSGPYDLPPAARDMLESMREREDGFVAGILNFFIVLVGGTIFGTLGGLLGALFFWRNGVPPAMGGYPPPPPPPPIPPQ